MTRTARVSSRRHTTSHKWGVRCLLFFLALLSRTVAGYLFFGSIDLLNSLENCRVLLSGQPMFLPYFPVIAAFIWLGGILSANSVLALAFCFKIVPIFFDALIAVLLYDMMRCRYPRIAFLTGILYALSPVAILITSLHAQWDAISMLLLLLGFHIREHSRKSMFRSICFGAFFGLAILVKPIALLYAPIFLLPWKNMDRETSYYLYGLLGLLALTAVSFILAPVAGVLCACVLIAGILYLWFARPKAVRKALIAYGVRQGDYLLGLLGALAVGCGLFWGFGYPLSQTLGNIISYADHGTQMFGLPFAVPFSLFSIFRSHLWLLLASFLITWPYLQGRLSTFSVLVVITGLMIGLSGLSPQYLFWLPPMLLINGQYRATTIYSLLVTVFLGLFYMSPHFVNLHGENLNTLAALRSCAWLMPPAYLSAESLTPLISALGNYLLPLGVLGFTAYTLVTQLRKPLDVDAAAVKPHTTPGIGIYIGAMVLLCVALMMTSQFVDGSGTLSGLTSRIAAIPTDYAIRAFPEFARFNLRYIGEYEHGTVCNILTLLLLLAAGGCWYAFTWARRHPEKKAVPQAERRMENAEVS